MTGQNAAKRAGTLLADSIPCAIAYVVDGDTLRCGSIRLRLLGIDAPELPGHCARNRECAPGDGFESRRRLIDAMRYGRLTYSIVTTDRYGRLVVEAWAGRMNLSCWQLQRGQAIYMPRWDNGGLVAGACP
jgi:micrococcal nuclease